MINSPQEQHKTNPLSEPVKKALSGSDNSTEIYQNGHNSPKHHSQPPPKTNNSTNHVLNQDPSLNVNLTQIKENLEQGLSVV